MRLKNIDDIAEVRHIIVPGGLACNYTQNDVLLSLVGWLAITLKMTYYCSLLAGLQLHSKWRIIVPCGLACNYTQNDVLLSVVDLQLH